MRTMTDHEQSTLTNALRVAAERFTEDAKVARAELHDGGRLAEQFERQHDDSIKLADEIENCSVVLRA